MKHLMRGMFMLGVSVTLSTFATGCQPAPVAIAETGSELSQSSEALACIPDGRRCTSTSQCCATLACYDGICQ